MEPITVYARPKVNLTLKVLGRRPDGYHELDSLVAFAQDLGDVIALTPSLTRSVTTIGPFGGSIAGENLISITLDTIARLAPGLQLGDVLLDKRLPIAAGIGGGSADAAAVINAVRSANPPALAIDWLAIAASIGADVPVGLQSTAQRMTGIGEVLRPAQIPQLCVVLVNPQVPVPADKTAQVFRKLAAPPLAAVPASPSPVSFASRDALLAHMRTVGNDLLPPARAIVPVIDELLAALGACPGCELAQLSGGGPTCFGIFPDMPTAHAAAASLAQTQPIWWIKASNLY